METASCPGVTTEFSNVAAESLKTTIIKAASMTVVLRLSAALSLRLKMQLLLEYAYNAMM